MRKYLPIILIVVLVAGGFYYSYIRIHRERSIEGPVLSVRFLDENFSYTVVLKTPDRKVIIIDPPTGRAGDALGNLLKDEHVREINVIIPNVSMRHILALSKLEQYVRVSRVIRPEIEQEIKPWSKLSAKVKLKRMSEIVVERGDIFTLSPNVRMETLNPVQETIHGDSGNDSLVFRIRFGNKSILFPTDIKLDGEADLIESGQDLSSSVFAIGRHGRYGSTSLEMLSMVRPEICIISAGYGNRPSTTILNRLNIQNTGAALYRTDKDGIITIITDGHSIQALTGGGGP